MKDRRRSAKVCDRCGRKIDPAIATCVECSSALGVVFTRRTDPPLLRRPRYGPRKVPGASRARYPIAAIWASSRAAPCISRKRRPRAQ